MTTGIISTPLRDSVQATLAVFTRWLAGYGETSWDHQSYYAGPLGRRAKGLYYRQPWLGTVAVAPMVFSEAFFPAARRLFHHRMRLPIADAHYAIGFALLHQATGDPAAFDRAVHFLDVLKDTRCPSFSEYCWGYPFDWVGRGGIIPQQTPLITTTPYVYEAFDLADQLHPRAEWQAILASIIRHAITDIKDYPYSETASTCSYTPTDRGGVVNASAYRAAMLVQGAGRVPAAGLEAIAAANVNFVLATQNADGSWPYAVDGVRDFVDHFHTCFVMKALAKIYHRNHDPRIRAALARGLDYYLANLIGADGMPRPFAKAPRMTVYLCELYDCAECINLCLLLRQDFPQLETTLATVVTKILQEWVKSDGSFRSRRLKFGWDNVPMHRWAQSQMFRSLALFCVETGGAASENSKFKNQNSGKIQ